MSRRIMNEIKQLQQSNELVASFDESNMKSVEVLFFGPSDSPYHHGIFVFTIQISGEYPFKVPIVEFQSGKHVQARMHPNLYQNGKVCLSILNTWGTPEWSPLLSLEKICITIRALLDNDPLAHEPAYYHTSKKYSEKHEHYRVCSQYYSIKSIPTLYNAYKNHPIFESAIRKYVTENADSIMKHCESMLKYEGLQYSTLHHNVVLRISTLQKQLHDFIASFK